MGKNKKDRLVAERHFGSHHDSAAPPLIYMGTNRQSAGGWTSFAKYLGMPGKYCRWYGAFSLNRHDHPGRDEHMGRFVRDALAAEGVNVSSVTTDPQRLTALVILGQKTKILSVDFYRENCADMAIEPKICSLSSPSAKAIW